jgi:hypothetical protein
MTNFVYPTLAAITFVAGAIVVFAIALVALH